MTRNLNGLSDSEVQASRERHGDNSLSREKNAGFFKKLLENLSDPIIKILIFAVILEVVVTLGRCNWFETLGIIIAVLIATVVSTVSEFGSERAFERMREDSENKTATVIREGKRRKIAVSDIVVGDLVVIRQGEAIPIDGLVVAGKITVDQSALNGESVEVVKEFSDGPSDELSSRGRVFRGSVTLFGECIARCDRVGADTYYGMVAKDIQAQTRTSPLKLRLGALASQISKLGYIMAFIVGITYLFFNVAVENNFDFIAICEMLSDIPKTVSLLTRALTLMITVVVVAVPEGLPMMITVVLSANMKKMMRDSIMVKKLVGIETAGSMNILFTDKTGTLTTGNTSVECIVTASASYKNMPSLRRAREIYSILCRAALYDGAEEGNGTDKALYSYFKSESTAALAGEAEPFSSEKKYSSVKSPDGSLIYKGAPEMLLPLCQGAILESGEIVFSNLSDVKEEYKRRADRAERVIAVAQRSGEGADMYFVALVSLKDKLREDARDAVREVQGAGVQVVMITGDSKETAAAIARECGILPKSSLYGVYSRDEIAKMTDEELKAAIPNMRVVARALPQDKTRLVRLSQELNLVVGMTGDGINDAPSLKLADIGFAMGSGTDIAKSASDIVIINNSFSAIVKTILYGRTIFKSIRKFITFQLTMNLVACGVSLFGQFLGVETPITIMQMLWINIIMDTLGALAFAGEPPMKYYMLEPPKSRDEKILSRDMLNQILITGGFTLVLCASFLFFDFFRLLFRYDKGDAYFLTGFYALFVFAGIFNCISARSERVWILSNLGKNLGFILIMLLISIVQILMIYFGGELFRCQSLSLRELLNVLLIAASVIPFDMLRRVFKKMA